MRNIGDQQSQRDQIIEDISKVNMKDDIDRIAQAIATANVNSRN